MSTRGNIIPLREASNYIGKDVDIMGVVVEFSFPRKSKGSDYVSILKIVDQSLQNPELSVHIFTVKCDELPHVNSDGDLIVLRKVRISKYEDGIFVFFSKIHSSFGLFGGKNSISFCPYQVFARFSLSWSERDIITNLRRWWCSAQIDSGKSDYLSSMKDISEEGYFDLLCKVLHLLHDASKGVWMLFVWDGTDVPPLSLEGKLKDEEQNPLPLQLESSPLDRDILCKFHHLGTVLRVSADKAHGDLGLHFQGVGKWAIIRNLTGRASGGMWHGSLTSSSRVRLLADNDSIVLDCDRKFKERKLEHDRLPLWQTPNCLTDIDYEEGVQFLTLMDLITHGKDGFVFCCVVRVVAILPLHPADLCSLDGMGECEMRLTLEDPTARIHAYLCSDEWVNFFGHRPCSDVLMMKIKSLLGVPKHQILEYDGNSSRHPPWIKCCIVSSRDKASKNRRHHICFTRLVTWPDKALGHDSCKPFWQCLLA